MSGTPAGALVGDLPLAAMLYLPHRKYSTRHQTNIHTGGEEGTRPAAATTRLTATSQTGVLQDRAAVALRILVDAAGEVLFWGGGGGEGGRVGHLLRAKRIVTNFTFGPRLSRHRHGRRSAARLIFPPPASFCVPIYPTQHHRQKNTPKRCRHHPSKNAFVREPLPPTAAIIPSLGRSPKRPDRKLLPATTFLTTEGAQAETATAAEAPSALAAPTTDPAPGPIPPATAAAAASLAASSRP